jgi:hypothetical protein
MQLDKGKLAGAINGREQVELAFCHLYFGDVDVKVANGVRLELLPGRLVAKSRTRQTGNPVPLQAAMQ